MRNCGVGINVLNVFDSSFSREKKGFVSIRILFHQYLLLAASSSMGYSRVHSREEKWCKIRNTYGDCFAVFCFLSIWWDWFFTALKPEASVTEEKTLYQKKEKVVSSDWESITRFSLSRRVPFVWWKNAARFHRKFYHCILTSNLRTSQVKLCAVVK